MPLPLTLFPITSLALKNDSVCGKALLSVSQESTQHLLRKSLNSPSEDSAMAPFKALSCPLSILAYHLLPLLSPATQPSPHLLPTCHTQPTGSSAFQSPRQWPTQISPALQTPLLDPPAAALPEGSQVPRLGPEQGLGRIWDPDHLFLEVEVGVGGVAAPLHPWLGLSFTLPFHLFPT